MGSFSKQHSYDKDALLLCGRGELFGAGNAQLPIDEMLMVDRIVHISSEGGRYGHGEIVGELDIRPELWFFKCHFIGDPVMPGCLGLDAMWQLLGFYLAWRGNSGRGRALGAGEIKFRGQVLTGARTVTYRLFPKNVVERRLVIGVADGQLEVDGDPVYHAKDLRAGLYVDAPTGRLNQEGGDDAEVGRP